MAPETATLIAAGFAAISAAVSSVITYKVTANSDLRKVRMDKRSAAYTEMLVVIDHVLASADEVAPMEGDFGSLLEGFEMGPEGRSRVAAGVRAHGSRAVRIDFDLLLSLYGQMQKMAMHTWDVHDRAKLEGFEVSPDYGLDDVDQLRQDMRVVANRIELTVRRELHGDDS